MPFRYRRKTARRYRRKNPLLKRKNLKHAVKSVLKSQIEHKVVYYNDQQSVTSLTYDPMLTPSQGDGINMRDGDVITPTSITGTIGFHRMALATAGTMTNVRCVIIRWNPDNLQEAPSTVANIFQGSTAQAPFVVTPQLRGKFDVLWDRTVLLTDAATDLYHSYKLLKVRIPLKGSRRTTFGSALTTGRGILYLLCLADQQDANQGALVTPYLRMGYLDG